MAIKVSYHRSGERRQMTVRDEMRLSAALAKVAGYGFTEPSVSQEHLDADPLVAIIQDWWPRGDEVAIFIRTRGKWRGQSVGCALRNSRRN